MEQNLKHLYLEISDLKVLIDEDDLARARLYKWRLEFNRGKYISVVASYKMDGRKQTVRLANIILPAPKGIITLLKCRSIHEKTIDMRKSNLFIGTRRDQNQTRPRGKAKTSKYRGVSFSSRRMMWLAQIKIDGTLIRLGYFDREEDAAIEYNRAVMKYFGKYAILNQVA